MAPEAFAQQVFDNILQGQQEVGNYFIEQDAYEKWLRMQQPNEAVADSVVNKMREVYPLLEATFRAEMETFQKEYQLEVAKGAVLSVAVVNSNLVPGIRYKYHIEMEIAFRKKRRITAVFWVFDVAWVNNEYHLLLPIEERF